MWTNFNNSFRMKRCTVEHLTFTRYSEFRCGGRFYFTVFRSLSTNPIYPKVKELWPTVYISVYLYRHFVLSKIIFLYGSYIFIVDFFLPFWYRLVFLCIMQLSQFYGHLTASLLSFDCMDVFIILQTSNSTADFIFSPYWLLLLIIIIIIPGQDNVYGADIMTQSHCVSSADSRDKCRTAPDGRRPLDQADGLNWAIGPPVGS